ncbi:MAG: hypothetical protein RR033_07055, partial [Clostridia bacterium]
DVIDLGKQIGTKQGTTVTENGIPMPTYNIDIKADKADVLGAINATEISGKQVYIPNTNNGFADKIDIVGNTVGGGGTTTAPNALISIENPINVISNSKNLFDENCFNTIGVLKNGFFEIPVSVYDFTNYSFLPNTVYTFSFSGLKSSIKNASYFYIIYTDNTSNFIRFSIDFQNYCLSSLPNKTVKYFSLTFGISNEGDNFLIKQYTFQLEIGSVATAYVSYEKSAVSISVKGADATLYPIRKINNNYYDRVFKDTDGKWYLEKKVGEASANITNAIPNSPYFGTMTSGGTATASGGIIVKSGETIDYALATPQKILLDQTETQKLETIKTYLGGTVISSNQTTGASPIFDVAEMTIGNRKQKAVVLVDNDSNAVFPMTKADCVILPDGTTIEYALNKTKSQWFNPSSTTKLKFDVYYQLAYSLGSGNSYLIAFGIFSINSNTKAYEFPNVEVISKPNNDHYSMRLRNGNEIPEFEVYLNGFLISPTPYSKIWIKELF